MPMCAPACTRCANANGSSRQSKSVMSVLASPLLQMVVMVQSGPLTVWAAGARAALSSPTFPGTKQGSALSPLFGPEGDSLIRYIQADRVEY
eukprot:jgi/Botrbrau1/17821/Bobra.0127s0066.1